MSNYLLSQEELGKVGSPTDATATDATGSDAEVGGFSQFEGIEVLQAESRQGKDHLGLGIVIGLVIGLILSAIIGVIWYRRNRKSHMEISEQNEKKDVQEIKTTVIQHASEPGTGMCKVGTLHNIGKRGGQQDSLGTTKTAGGMFAVVADGMGGLADGDRVSQSIVMTMLQDAASLPAGGNETRLYEMAAHANREVNRLLGAEGQYKSGSTLIAVLVEDGCFHWISVGDSRIYLYRGGNLLQINPEHTYEAELMQQAVNGDMSFQEAKKHPKRSGLTSFLGMGDLKYVDGSKRGVTSCAGDRILLMSDGVFNTLKEKEICRVMRENADVEQAAAVLEEQVLIKNNPKQDNFTAVIMEISGL